MTHMKAYKIVRVVKNRYFSIAVATSSIKLYVAKKKIGSEIHRIVEYKKDKWSRGKPHGTIDGVFAFNNYENALAYLKGFQSTLPIQVWLADIEISDFYMPSGYPGGTIICKRLKLTNMIKQFAANIRII